MCWKGSSGAAWGTTLTQARHSGINFCQTACSSHTIIEPCCLAYTKREPELVLPCRACAKHIAAELILVCIISALEHDCPRHMLFALYTQGCIMSVCIADTITSNHNLLGFVQEAAQ